MPIPQSACVDEAILIQYTTIHILSIKRDHYVRTLRKYILQICIITLTRERIQIRVTTTDRTTLESAIANSSASLSEYIDAAWNLQEMEIRFVERVADDSDNIRLPTRDQEHVDPNHNNTHNSGDVQDDSVVWCRPQRAVRVRATPFGTARGLRLMRKRVKKTTP